MIEVEAASYGFDSLKRPRILFEPHIFYRELSGASRANAVAEGLAYPRWAERPYPGTMDARYAQLVRAMRIDRDAALKSASWGLGQVMGFNYRIAGHANIIEFVDAMKAGEAEQLMAMAHFIKSNGLDKHMRNQAWSQFAQGYNGKGYAKHGYHLKLATAYRKYAGTEMTRQDIMVRLGSRGHPVVALQTRLNVYGFGMKVDGIFGQETMKAVHAFQTKHGLLVDGVVGKATWAVLLSDPAQRDPAPQAAIPAPAGVEHEREAGNTVKEVAKTGEGAGGLTAALGTAGVAMSSAADQIAPFTGIQIVQYLFVGLIVVGIGITLYAAISRVRAEP